MYKDKKELRKEYREVREIIPSRFVRNIMLQQKVLNSSAVKEANTVFLYLSVRDEVETSLILEELLKKGVRVLVPRCRKEPGMMDAVEITDLSMVHRNSRGLFEPSPDLPAVPKEEIDVAIVPGLAFDWDRYRLGYGGGYYDRFLVDFQGWSIGLSYWECVTDRLPRDEFDQPVDEVITETSP